MVVRVLQISDTHVGHTRSHFLENWQKVHAWVEEQDADLLLHTGDVTLDGAGEPQDLPFCADLLRSACYSAGGGARKP